MVPLRPLFEALGTRVEWNQQTKTATAVKGNLTLKLTEGSTRAWINHSEHTLKQAPILSEKTFYINLRVVSEVFGIHIRYVKNPLTIYLESTDHEFSQSYLEAILQKIIDNREQIERQHSIRFNMGNVENDQMWIEIRNHGNIEKAISEPELAEIKKTLFEIANIEFPLSLTIRECCTREADITGTITEVDQEKNRLLVIDEREIFEYTGEPMATWIQLTDDGKVYPSGKESPIPLNQTLVGKEAKAWTVGIYLTSNPGQTSAVKVVVEE